MFLFSLVFICLNSTSRRTTCFFFSLVFIYFNLILSIDKCYEVFPFKSIKKLQGLGFFNCDGNTAKKLKIHFLSKLWKKFGVKF